MENLFVFNDFEFGCCISKELEEWDVGFGLKNYRYSVMETINVPDVPKFIVARRISDDLYEEVLTHTRFVNFNGFNNNTLSTDTVTYNGIYAMNKKELRHQTYQAEQLQKDGVYLVVSEERPSMVESNDIEEIKKYLRENASKVSSAILYANNTALNLFFSKQENVDKVIDLSFGLDSTELNEKSR